jgi:L-ribulose-5-phosphate 3-epimerase
MSAIHRRSAIGLAAGTVFALAGGHSQAKAWVQSNVRRSRFAVSTYSFWQFKNQDLRDIETCINLATEWGFDGIELLEMQMQDKSNSYLQRIKQRAFMNGLDLCGFPHIKVG